MEITELKSNLRYLIDKYIDDAAMKKKLYEEIEIKEVPGVKGVLAEIQKSGKKIDTSDGKLIKDIVFNFV